jgi:hypothetical protein
MVLRVFCFWVGIRVRARLLELADEFSFWVAQSFHRCDKGLSFPNTLHRL